MPWNRQDPDPLEAHRRKLAEKERLLSEQMKTLTQKLRQAGEPVPAVHKPSEPPVWRLEEETLPGPVDNTRRPALALQRRRDRLIFFIFVGVLFVAAAICLWIYHTRDMAGGGM